MRGERAVGAVGAVAGPGSRRRAGTGTGTGSGTVWPCACAWGWAWAGGLRFTVFWAAALGALIVTRLLQLVEFFFFYYLFNLRVAFCYRLLYTLYSLANG